VVCLLAANHGSSCSLLLAMDGCIVRCGIISSCQSAATSEIVKAFATSLSYVRSTTASTGLYLYLYFVCTTAATAVAHLSHCNSVCLSVRPPVTRVDQSTKSSLLAAWKTPVSGTVKLFHKFKGGHFERRC